VASVPELVVKVKLDTEELRGLLTQAWDMGVRRGYYSRPLFTLEQSMEDCPFDDMGSGGEES
jgi:hypothetical protein